MILAALSDEANWEQGRYLHKMLAYMRKQKASPRKWRLVAVACCRDVWEHLIPEGRAAVEAAEAWADGRISQKQLLFARRPVESQASELLARAQQQYGVSLTSAEQLSCEYELLQAAVSAATPRVDRVQQCLWYASGAPGVSRADAYARQAHLLRDIFGNPFRPVAFDPAWRTSTAVAVAQQMYDSRDFGAMPILADALQDAGCEDDAILSHCHDAKQAHVRGCWVCDLVLAK